jgi:hypothetical protein
MTDSRPLLKINLILLPLILLIAGLNTAFACGGNPIGNQLHPNYDLTTIRPEGFEPPTTEIALFPDGRLVLTTIRFGSSGHMENREYHYPGKVFLVEGAFGNRDNVEVKELMTNMYDATGVIVVDDTVFVAVKDRLLRLLSLEGGIEYDRNQANKPGQYETVGTWDHDTEGTSNHANPPSNYHEFSHGPLYKDGKFYVGLCIADPLPPSFNAAEQRDAIVTVDRYTGETEIWAWGTRTPNGLSWGPEGTILQAENQGNYRPSSALYVLRKDRFYGFANRSEIWDNYSNYRDQTYPPAVWLRHGVASNSPSGAVYVQEGPYKGQVFMGDMCFGGVTRNFIEKVNGEWQGCGFLHSGGFEAGTQALTLAPDGKTIFVGGLGVSGFSGWIWQGKVFGLQRWERNNSEQIFEVTAVRAKQGGFEIEYSQPIGSSARDQGKYSIIQWYNVLEIGYGAGMGQGNENLSIASLQPCDDGRRVFLQLNGLKDTQGDRNYVVNIKFNGIYSEAGQESWNKQAWYTLNDFSSSEPCMDPPAAPLNVQAELTGQDAAKITWQTDPNENRGIHYYTVYRDGEDLGIVEGMEYIDRDIDPAQAEEYEYKVAAFTFDNQASEKSQPGSITSVDDYRIQKRSPSFKVRAVQSSILVHSNYSGLHLVELYDMLGNKLETVAQSGPGLVAIQMHGHPEGVYFVRLCSKGNSSIKRVLYSR